MVERDPFAAEWAEGMPGGPRNPLGARALYLYQGKVDTLYRIHGTFAPSSIGKAVSSGCIRMINADVADLYNRVPTGTRVVVLQNAPDLDRDDDRNDKVAKRRKRFFTLFGGREG
jgi:lipoprotein-anchoring transpeptidase ErfK/SrfK